jgi:hypothetical protein
MVKNSPMEKGAGGFAVSCRMTADVRIESWAAVRRHRAQSPQHLSRPSGRWDSGALSCHLPLSLALRQFSL